MTRDEARIAVRTALETYCREFGIWIETPGQEVMVANLADRIDHRIVHASFEEALQVLERIARLNDNTHSLHINGYGYDIHPNDPDYPQAKAHHILSAEQELTEHINNIAGDGCEP